MKRLVLLLILLMPCGRVLCVEVDLSLQQLNHKGWSVADGAPGAIYAITQTTDGTLWLGGPSGLSRFDGIRFVRYDGFEGRPFESTDIKTIAASTDGGLWIGYVIGGVSLLKDGVITNYREHEGLPRGTVHNIVTDQTGVTYAATTQGLYRFRLNKWEPVLIYETDPTAFVASAIIDRLGGLWVVTLNSVLVRTVGSTKFIEVAKRNNPRHISDKSLASGVDGQMWVLNLNRLGAIARLHSPTDSPSGTIPEIAFADTSVNPGMLVDREGDLWIGGLGVHRLRAGALKGDLKDSGRTMESFTPTDGLTGAAVNCFFEDREGNIWAGTYSGLDRFSRSKVVRVNHPNTFGASVAGDSGTVWVSTVGPSDSYPILEIVKGTVVREYPGPHFTSAYRSPDGSIWFGGRTGISRFENGRLTTIPLPEKGEVQAMAQDDRNAMWVSISQKGLYRLKNGEWAANGNLSTLPDGIPLVEAADTAGSLWLGYTWNRLARVEASSVKLFGSADGLDVGNITALAGRSHTLWVGGDRGLARFNGTHFNSVSSSHSSFTGISGIVELKNGDLWLNSNTGIIHIAKTEIERTALDPSYQVRSDVFNYLDGLRGYARQLRPTPTALEDSDGHLWFATQLGLVSIDPATTVLNTLPPPVTIWSLGSHEVRYSALQPIQLPIHARNVRIEYTAASLTVPERVRFRYKLQGVDQDWQEAEDRREAVYTSLGPGEYIFHVIAANNDGVWNTTGASLHFSIAAAFYQTRWFYALCALLAFALLCLLYMARIRQVSAQVRQRLEGVLIERERIARELHDTLLQSVQGLILRFQASVAHIPPTEPARAAIEQALNRADEVLGEGRDRVKYLRSSSTTESDLPQAIAALGRELSADQATDFRSSVEGDPRELHPIVREEALFIAREALINAFRHANAAHIEANISYGASELRIRLHDDGKGIDPELQQRGGRTGHWGLLGMRERAGKVHATLVIRSKPSAGTEVELRIPGHIAYRSTEKMKFRLWRRMPLVEAEGGGSSG